MNDTIRKQVREILDGWKQLVMTEYDGTSFIKQELEAVAQAEEDIMKLIVEVRIDEKIACQRIIFSTWGTNDQLWDMQDRINSIQNQLKEQNNEN